MCGIIAILQSTLDKKKLKETLVQSMRLIRHRGPDWNGTYINEFHITDGHNDINEILTNALGHERLTIVDPNTGSQPLFNEDKTVVVTVNGEIYNHKTLQDTILKNHEFSTSSDCEVIAHLYEEIGMANGSFVKYLDGVFAFVLLDTKTGKYVAGRDPIGVNPLYYGYDQNGAIWFASELKVLEHNCSKYYVFPPGHIMSNIDDTLFTKWYNPGWGTTITVNPINSIKRGLISAVKKRLMADVPFGVLLSGGLDSSLIASIAARMIGPNNKLKTFSIGLKNSPDLLYAQQVARFLNTEHYSWVYTIEEGIDAISDVIRHIESFDVTTVRASTPMYLLDRRIKAIGVKMVLSGEGADEIFGGYLYFHKAPNSKEFFDETVRKLDKLHYYDCLRANKSTMAWGVEARVPFLDKQFLDIAMNTDPELKMIIPRDIACSSSESESDSSESDSSESHVKKSTSIEKYILRAAFSQVSGHKYLPDNVLWRQKEQFSDGVGYGWIDGLKDHANSHITNHEFRNAKHIFPKNTPRSKEEFWYRKIFETHYGSESSVNTVPYETSVACSTSIAAEWDAKWKNNEDPSGRAVDVHDSSNSIH